MNYGLSLSAAAILAISTLSATRATADPTSPPMAVFDTDDGRPACAFWDGTRWQDGAPIPGLDNRLHFVVVRNCPTRHEYICVVQDQKQEVHLTIFDGQTWRNGGRLTDQTGQNYDRTADVVYEQRSGDALIVFADRREGIIGYRTFDGVSISARGELRLPAGTRSDYLSLYPHPDRNEVVLLAVHSKGGNSGARFLSANSWDGDAWGGWRTLETDLETTDSECYSLAFEGDSGKGVAVWAKRRDTKPRYRIWDGTVWSAEGVVGDIGANAQWLRLSAHPDRDEIVFASLDARRDINVAVWNGSQWTAVREVAADTQHADRRGFDVQHTRSGNALLVYNRKNETRLRFRTWDGQNWSPESTGANLGRPIRAVQVRRGSGANELLIAASDQNKDLHLVSWDGESMGTAYRAARKLHGSPQNEAFMLAGQGRREPVRIARWREVRNPDAPGS